MKKLIIAEKPSLAKNIAIAVGNTTHNNGYYENDNYLISYAFGHFFQLKDIKDYENLEKLPWENIKLPYIPKFEFKLKDDPGAIKQFQIIKNLIERHDISTIVNCGDADREGQIIIDLIIEAANNTKPVERLWLPEQTEETIRANLENLEKNENYLSLNQEGLARTYMDWLLGINLTIYVSVKSGKRFNIGRVLYPIVKKIFDRDLEIRNFKKTTYLQVESINNLENCSFKLLTKKKFSEEQENLAIEFSNNLNSQKAKVINIEKKEIKKQAGKLFSLSKLQSQLSKKEKINFSTSEKIIQKLYELGYITYPRTNTEYLANNEKAKVQAILSSLEENVIFKDSKKIFDDSKIESHSALIITTKKPNNLSPAEEIVYKTIYNRFISNFLNEDTITEKITLTIAVGEEIFNLNGETIKNIGFYKYEPEKIENQLPNLNLNDEFEVNFLPVKKITSPPKKLSEEELANYLKNPFKKDSDTEDEEYMAILAGVEIGTEATRTGIVEKAKFLNYISQAGSNYSIESDGEKLIEIINKLEINLEKEKSVEFSQLQKKVFLGEETLASLISNISKELETIINSNIEIEKIEFKTEKESFGICPKCGGAVYEGKTKDNKINYYCSNYKECSFKLYEEMKHFSTVLKLTKTKVKSLLASKKTLFKILGKENKEYEGYLKLKINGNFVNFENDGYPKTKTPKK